MPRDYRLRVCNLHATEADIANDRDVSFTDDVFITVEEAIAAAQDLSATHPYHVQVCWMDGWEDEILIGDAEAGVFNDCRAAGRA